MSRYSDWRQAQVRTTARRMMIVLTLALSAAALATSPAAASRVTPASAHRPGSTLNRLTSGARLSFDMSHRRLAGAVDLRDPLGGASNSIELGAPPSVPVGANPSGIAVNAETQTVYVVNNGDDTVAVIDARACNALHPSGCTSPLATIPLGPSGSSGAVAAVVSPDGTTLYVTSPGGANTVAVIDAATCNAMNVAGCGDGPIASVATGQGPTGLAEDPLTQTLYVTNIVDNTVSVIDGAMCNAGQTAGCTETAPTVAVGTAPFAVGVDPATHTAYVANIEDDTVSAIDTTSCNAEQPAGCATTPPVQAVGGAPAAIAVSAGGHKVYVANSGVNFEGNTVPGGNTLSVIDAGACNAENPEGCSAVPAPVVAVGAGQDNWPQSVAVDPRTRRVYEANSNDDTLSVIGHRRCGAPWVHGCARPAPTVQTGAGPSAIAVLPGVHTVYVADSADNAVGVLDDRTCTHADPLGCRPAPAPVAQLAPDHVLYGAAVDPAQHTAYVIDSGVNNAGPYALDLIDTTMCNAGHRAGCDPYSALASVPLASSPSAVAVDRRTNTVYVAEGGPGPNQLQVIAAATCNARVTSCLNQATIPFADGSVPQQLVVDSDTRTVYMGLPRHIAVIDARHCNAEDMTDCATQTPAKIPVPFGGMAVAHDTLYSTGLQSFDTPGWVSVIDTRHCRAGDTSQCASQNPPRVTVGLFPEDAAVDPAHHTLYVVDNAFGASPGQLSMIDTTHCNGDDVSDCAGQTAAAIPMRRAPVHETFDPSTSTLYVTNFFNASVSVINTATCRATNPAGCPSVPPQIVVGSGPLALALDPASRTLYVTSFWDGTVSLVPTGS